MKILVDTYVVLDVFMKRQPCITHIVTRNEADYKSTAIQCLSPAGFIAYLENAK